MGLWLQAGVAPVWLSEMRTLLHVLTEEGGPVAAFVRPGRSKIAVSWSVAGGKEARLASISKRTSVDRALNNPKTSNSLGHVMFTVWEDGHPFHDEREDHVHIFLHYSGAIPQTYVQIWATALDSSAMVESVNAWVRIFGARFAGAFYSGEIGEEPVDPPLPPWHPYVKRNNLMPGLLEMGLVDPVVLGPSWVMVFRPNTFSSNLVPAGSRDHVAITKIAGPDGEYTLVVLGPDATTVTTREMDPWLETLGPLMEPALNDPDKAHQLRQAAIGRRKGGDRREAGERLI